MAKFPMPLLALLFANAAAASTATTTANASIEMAILWVKPDASRPQGGTTRLFRAGDEDFVLLGNTIPNAFPPPPSTGSGAQTNNRSLVTAADRYLPPGTYLVELCTTQSNFVLPGGVSSFTAHDAPARPPPPFSGCDAARIIFTRPGEAHRRLFGGSMIVEFKKAANGTTTNDGFYVHFNVVHHQGYDEAGNQKFTAAHEEMYGATIKFTKLK